MRVRTYYVYLPKYDIAFNQDKLIDFQSELDKVVGFNKCGLNINSTPLNKDVQVKILNNEYYLDLHDKK